MTSHEGRVAALVAAFERAGVVDQVDGCMPVFARSEDRKLLDSLIHHWTTAGHIAELVINELGEDFFACEHGVGGAA